MTSECVNCFAEADPDTPEMPAAIPATVRRDPEDTRAMLKFCIGTWRSLAAWLSWSGDDAGAQRCLEAVVRFEKELEKMK